MIRKAKLGDIPGLIAMGRRFYEAAGLSRHGLGFHAGSLHVQAAQLITRPQNGVVLVSADDDAHLTGSLGGVLVPWFLDLSQTQAIELWWWIEPGARGRGEALSLLKTFEAWARLKGASVVKMASLPLANQSRLDRFYLKKGYWPADHFFGKGLKYGD